MTNPMKKMTDARQIESDAFAFEFLSKLAERESWRKEIHRPVYHIHKWWAQRPLAACRAVLFASLVDDPSSHPELFPTEETQERERQRLFRLIGDLVKWENSNNAKVLEQVRAEIRKSGPWLQRSCDGYCGVG